MRETLTPGGYNAVICADAADRVRESNERNNEVVHTFQREVTLR